MKLLDSLTNSVKNAFSKNINEPTPKETVDNILKTNWDLTDDFEFILTNEFLSKNSVEIFNNEILAKAVVSVEVPVLTSQEMDVVFAGVRRTNVRMQELFRFTVRFRDFDKGIIRKYFTTLFIAQQYLYFDDVKSNIVIKLGNKTMFGSENCFISQISAVTYDHNNTGISEFDVTFVSTSYSDEFISNFGSDTEYNHNFSNKTFSSSSTIKSNFR
jgi:hypothetical protein